MSAEKQDTQETPHYHGHRDRLRARFLENGESALADYELLELLLFTCIPRRDVKPLAKDIIKTFGGLPEAMNATADELQEVSGVSANTAITLKTVNALARRLGKQALARKPLLKNWTQLMDYCHATLAHEKREQFRILFMTKKNELIADEIQSIGTVDHTPVYIREVIKRALDLGASALILLHNHPSGDSTPSPDDIAMTASIIAAAAPMNLIIHDHIIVSRNGYSSFKDLGLI